MLVDRLSSLIESLSDTAWSAIHLFAAVVAIASALWLLPRGLRPPVACAIVVMLLGLAVAVFVLTTLQAPPQPH